MQSLLLIIIAALLFLIYLKLPKPQKRAPIEFTSTEKGQ